MTRCTPIAPVSTRCLKKSEEEEAEGSVASLNDGAGAGADSGATFVTPRRSCAMYAGSERGCGCHTRINSTFGLLGSWFGPEVALNWLFPYPRITRPRRSRIKGTCELSTLAIRCSISPAIGSAAASEGGPHACLVMGARSSHSAASASASSASSKSPRGSAAASRCDTLGSGGSGWRVELLRRMVAAHHVVSVSGGRGQCVVRSSLPPESQPDSGPVRRMWYLLNVGGSAAANSPGNAGSVSCVASPSELSASPRERHPASS